MKECSALHTHTHRGTRSGSCTRLHKKVYTFAHSHIHEAIYFLLTAPRGQGPMEPGSLSGQKMHATGTLTRTLKQRRKNKSRRLHHRQGPSTMLNHQIRLQKSRWPDPAPPLDQYQYQPANTAAAAAQLLDLRAAAAVGPPTARRLFRFCAF
jgi:hypothetical protein